MRKARLERMRQVTLLFNGKHRDYFLGESTLTIRFPADARRQQGDQSLRPVERVETDFSKKSADLLFGEEPLIRVEDDIQAAALAALADRASLHQRFHAAAVSCSARAEAFVECSIAGGLDAHVYVRTLPAAEMFPVGDRQADGQYAAYRRLTIAQIGGTTEKPINGLLETIYAVGEITRTLKQLDEQGAPMQQVGLDAWPGQSPDLPLTPATKTGLQTNTVTWVPNEFDLDETTAISDYDGLIELQDELNAKQTQIARVLAKHSDPKMAFPARSFDDDGTIHTSYGAFPFNSKDEIPQYIVWNAELAAALEDRKFTLNLLLITAETSPVLLGLKEGGAPDAFKKVRLEASNSLSKAQRKASTWKNAVKRVVGTAMQLEQTIPGTRYNLTPVSCEIRDGIPVDELDQANRISILRASGTMSVLRGVTEQLTDAGAVKAEVAELQQEASAAMPTILMQPPSGGQEAGSEVSPAKAKDDQGNVGADDADAAAAERTEVAA